MIDDNQDVGPLGKQLCDLFSDAHWAVNCVGIPRYHSEIPVPLPRKLIGLHCYNTNLQVRKAFQDSDLDCTYEAGSFSSGGMTINALVILIGNTAP
jgi:hypothetical protein